MPTRKQRANRWQPMQRARMVTPEHVREMAESSQVVADHIKMSQEMWVNDRYTVIVYRRESDGSVECLSIRRNDRGAVRDWRHMQKIKTELAGAGTEAFQMFPAESRVVDTANQTWLWCLPPGVRMPVGFHERVIEGPEAAAKVGARQREFEEGVLSEVQ